MASTWPRQLSVSKHGVVRPVGAELDFLNSIKVDVVIDLQNRYPEHTIWLVGELIHVIRAEGNQTRAPWGEAAILESYCAMNAKNLLQLADFLDTLPAEKFDMDAFARDEHGEVIDYPAAHDCGTVCCAAGWGPTAGMPPLPSERDWGGYIKRVFGISLMTPEWIWCFSAAWSRVDNTPAGAAKRIRHLVEHGLPDDWKDQLWGRGYIFHG